MSYTPAGKRLQPIGAPGDLLEGVDFAAGQARQRSRSGHPRGGVVESVETGSPSWRSGVQPGDVIISLNGRRLRDVIDYQFLAADEEVLALDIVRPGKDSTTLKVEVWPEPGENPGLSFTQPTFAPIRECNNHCPFCFIDQLPGTMRNSLYIRDDDYRYSFLFGNFVTLTNLNERDWERLAEQRLSPLYVSVHATDLKVRRVLLGNDRAADIMPQLKRLFSLGIKVHTQVVTCPGLNDGPVLEQTVRDLSAHFPDVLSIGVVPVGLTRTPSEILADPGASCSRILPSAGDLPMRTFQRDEARRVVSSVRNWQRRFRDLHDCSLVYASDEFYLLAGAPVPPAGSYDGYPQYENGIGMVRDLVDDWSRLRRRLKRNGTDRSTQVAATLVCGEMISPRLGTLAAEWADVTGARVDVVPLANRFFGPRVRVSGLLTGQDIIESRHQFKGDIVILPAVTLDKTGSRMLDGLSPDDMSRGIGKPVYFAGYLSEVDRILFN